MVEYLTDGVDFLSIDTDRKCFTLRQVADTSKCVLVDKYTLTAERKECMRSEEYRMKWNLPYLH